jgi:energy-coupling factor transporter ATP-binding protein EcfA2
MDLNKNIITDLELIETIEPSGNSIYSYTFQPQTNLGKKVLTQFSKYYTTDIVHLKDTQQLLKNFTPISKEIFRPDFDNIMNIWDEIKNDTGFKEKYQYIDWPFWEFLNNSDTFLEVMSIYNLCSPVISFVLPVFILIIPFFVIQMKGVSLTISEYVDVLKVIASNHAIGKLFTQFNSVKLDEKMYLLISAFFYLFSIYQNILTCIRFNDNMRKIHIYLNDIKNYILYTEESMNNLLSYTAHLNTYSYFNKKINENMIVLKQFREQLQIIQPYKMNAEKIMNFGHILKCFYQLYDDPIYNESFLYSFGFHGYIDNIEGIISNINQKYINFAKISKSKKSKKNKKRNMIVFKKSYYPSLIHSEPVKNNIRLDKNIIITGPNASGKTTVLKSTLINIIISQQIGCGFYNEANIEPFKFIHCYLNIPDTSGRDSLFQAEARRCKDILDIISQNELETHFCAFDELYSGTNPDEAIMSANAFLNYLSSFKTVKCLLTTHFIGLCNQLDKNKNFENCHMETINDNNSHEFNYTYYLKKGISNVRGGIKILQDMNYPDEIIQNTIGFL